MKCKTTKCPRCGSKQVVPILYGMPSPEMIERSARGEIVIGGCLTSENNPCWECLACGQQLPMPNAKPTPKA